MGKNFYITTTIPYVNADPHIGFALEIVQADVIARYKRLIGQEVFFSTGTDEHGQKIYEASKKENLDIQLYVDKYAKNYLDLKDVLDLSNDNFIRTTDKNHIEAVEHFWKLCLEKGDIYKGFYCVGCEKFITEKDLKDGKCEFHPTLTPEIIEEENYFFKITNYKEKLLSYLEREEVIVPEWRRMEAINFVKNDMEDFSISRDKKRFSWGISIPEDDSQVMYVWFDAFINYISTLGWPNNKEQFENFWQNGDTVQVAGKDMVKFQSVMWQGMLMSAGFLNTKKIVYHGFVTGEGGIRMSKSIGNVISPKEIVDEYGTDALRYFLLREISSFEDSPFTKERFKEAYNSGLANGLGNLTSRILTLSEKYLEKTPETSEKIFTECFDFLENFEIQKSMNYIWGEIGKLDQFIQETEPFKVVKNDEKKGKELIFNLVLSLYTIARMLQPFLPETSIKIEHLIKENKKPSEPLFLRK